MHSVTDGETLVSTWSHARKWLQTTQNIVITNDPRDRVCFHMIADVHRTVCDLWSAIVCGHMETMLSLIVVKRLSHFSFVTSLPQVCRKNWTLAPRRNPASFFTHTCILSPFNHLCIPCIRKCSQKNFSLRCDMSRPILIEYFIPLLHATFSDTDGINQGTKIWRNAVIRSERELNS